MADSGIITPAPSRRPGSSRIKNNDDDTPKTIKEVNGFTILEKVGQGGMGAVYKARQKSLDRVVALKILPPRIAKSKTFIERFQREARASAKLCHPNLVQGIDIGQDPASKLWYFAMEFVDGPSLKKLMKQEQRIDERRALEIVREVARALDAINSVGMIHRDIKPDNILLTSRGEVKVADFGLTREVDDDSEMTQSGHAIGTPHYMPPEQVRGENDLDIRADLYALGATFYHLVTGKTPFAGNSSAEIMSKHLTEAAPLACALSKDVSEPCSRLIQKLMEKKRDDRVQTPQELVSRINVLLDPDNSVTGKRSTVNGRANKSGARSAVGRAVTGPRSPISQTGPRAQISGGIESTGPLQRVSTGQRAAVSPDSTTGSAQPVSGDARDAAASAQRKAVRKQSLRFL